MVIFIVTHVGITMSFLPPMTGNGNHTTKTLRFGAWFMALFYPHNVGPPSYKLIYKFHENYINISTINHSYWSYWHQLSYLGVPTLHEYVSAMSLHRSISSILRNWTSFCLCSRTSVIPWNTGSFRMVFPCIPIVDESYHMINPMINPKNMIKNDGRTV